MGKRIEIVFGKNGSVDSQAFEFVGDECDKESAFLDKLYGKPANRVHKESYYATESDKDKLADGLPGGYCG